MGFVIFIKEVGYYKGKTFKYKDAKGRDLLYPYTTDNEDKAKKYSSSQMALKEIKDLRDKCGISFCSVKEVNAYGN